MRPVRTRAPSWWRPLPEIAVLLIILALFVWQSHVMAESVPFADCVASTIGR